MISKVTANKYCCINAKNQWELYVFDYNNFAGLGNTL